ncbi:MAG: SpoIID/LytB domain-containing protein [Bacteroidales bacterium]
MKYCLLVLSIALSITGANAQKISVSLFNDLNLQTILVTPVKGSYSIITEEGSFNINPNQIIYISRAGDSVKVRDMASHLGTWERVSIVGKGDENVIRLNPISPSVPARIYDDNLGFYIDFERMMAINIVEIDNYIAGVIEAESGPSAQLEFYKAQALLARTFAYGHMERHSGEGFNLCDEVHCQVYKGKSTKNPKIYEATNRTKNQVVVDNENNMIFGAFHGNCGGQTANAGDVWLKNHSYLVSVNDSYCKARPSSQWEVKIPKEEWIDFLAKQGVDTDKITNQDLTFNPKGRGYHYQVRGKSIPLTEIRKHFQLRSAYLSIEAGSDEVKIIGKGYGHGVGMCQDGAMQMARKGKTYKDIIEHYFKEVRIIKYTEANGFEEDSLIDMNDY